jgi:hypothetical protein
VSSGLGAQATAWMDEAWDPDAGLLWNMEGSFDGEVAPRTLHLVPQSAWYALGLLRRGRAEDVARAHAVVEAVAATQYDEPGTVWHGTFARFQEWPPPAEGAREWVDYDPNWRQFVGTAFSLILLDHRAVLEPGTEASMRAAIDLAVRGEPEGRVPAWYSNIALMKAWLDVEAGRAQEGEALAEAVVAAFRRTGAFLEYGSPTYYGIDLFALGLWRSRSSSPQLRAWGAELEAALWQDVARWYHAGLRNLCGPYARAYGMDMTAYAGLLGLWIWEGLGADGQEVAPFPDLHRPFSHAHDLCLAPCIEALGARIPDEVVPALRAFPGEHVVEQVVDEELGLVATGWLGDDVMVGAARGGGFNATRQYHPATIHWRSPDGGVGWLRLVHDGPLDATAGARSLTITVFDHPRRGPAPTMVSSSHPGTFEPGRWTFPGLTVVVEGAPSTSPDGVVATTGTTTFTLRI